MHIQFTDASGTWCHEDCPMPDAECGRLAVAQNDEQAQAVVTYDDDRRGLMRVHIAQRRGDLACDRYSRNTLRAFARWRMLAPSSLQKRDLATRMAYEGLIDADGYLRDGFPAVVTSPGSTTGGDPR